MAASYCRHCYAAKINESAAPSKFCPGIINLMITIHIPDEFAAERTYITDRLFGEFLGLQYNIRTKPGARHYEVVLENSNTILIKDSFFSGFRDGLDYLEKKAIPSKIKFAGNCFCPEPDIPVIFGDDELTISKEGIICGIDIFASSFFMLTRWEEYVNKSRDSHNRFPAAASLSYKEGFLHRAVVNEYAEMLWGMLSHLKIGQREKEKGVQDVPDS